MRSFFGRGTRFAYNLFALITFFPLLHLEHQYEGLPIFVWPTWMLPLRLLLLAVAAWLLWGGCRVFSLSDFSGVGALLRAESAGPPAETLMTDGILSRLRHPWYAAALLLLWLRDLSSLALLSSAILSLYLVVGACLEEKRLLARYGEAYARYCAQVPMFLPRLRQRS